ncbi:ribonuclease III [Coxiella-like endosymbiont of Amblyomma americanum]|uniref:ribonuclease III n=1 Tax=Coxiella-like endosymbiont of Amblyomma americanum TaxID=1987500 RepID=UPI000F89E370|nr:ribonuclease III [Coxiella-like endosymbiont of Amblyomma americanum]AUJ58609.1 ribonuclease III [Coxiella-like endosymbiont of Amblyomma americanum]
MNKFDELMQNLKHQFNDVGLLQMALSHRSVGVNNNERLEFLGDSILGFVITLELYKRYPKAQEGELSQMRASVVNGNVLAQLSVNLGIDANLLVGASEHKRRAQLSILSDALEAVVGAIYLDAGLEKCRCCLLSWYSERIDDLSTLIPKKDAKSRLQEWLQARKLSLPIYEILTSGEAHAKIFTATCCIKGLFHRTEGIGTTRRQAEQTAAMRFLELVEKNE